MVMTVIVMESGLQGNRNFQMHTAAGMVRNVCWMSVLLYCIIIYII